MRIYQSDHCVFQQTLYYSNRSKRAIDLTNADHVDVILYKYGDIEPYLTKEVGIAQPPTSGTVEVEFTSEETSELGMYTMVYKIYWSGDGGTETVPSGEIDWVLIRGPI